MLHVFTKNTKGKKMLIYYDLIQAVVSFVYVMLWLRCFAIFLRINNASYVKAASSLLFPLGFTRFVFIKKIWLLTSSGKWSTILTWERSYNYAWAQYYLWANSFLEPRDGVDQKTSTGLWELDCLWAVICPQKRRKMYRMATY